jgi:hypothetical protein
VLWFSHRYFSWQRTKKQLTLFEPDAEPKNGLNNDPEK